MSDRDEVRFAEIASAKARGDSVSTDDEALFQMSLLSAENAAEAEFWSDLVAYAENEEPSSFDIAKDRVLVDRVLARHQQQSQVRRQRKWLFRGSALAMSAAALWAIFVLEPRTSMWIVRTIPSTEKSQQAGMFAERSELHGEARPRQVRERPDKDDPDSVGMNEDLPFFKPGDMGEMRASEASKISIQGEEPQEIRENVRDSSSSSKRESKSKSSKRVVVSAEQMLIFAQKQLAKGNRRQAWHGYRTLLRRYPKSVEARVALVSLGRIGLQLGYTKRALRYFERYIRQGKSDLVEEALVGRIEALAKLGDKSGEMGAILELMEKAPNSAYRRKFQLRLDQLKTDVE